MINICLYKKTFKFKSLNIKNLKKNIILPMTHTLDILSQVVGWISFTAWSISFYGQCYLNWKLKRLFLAIKYSSLIFFISVEGFSLKFEVLNITGFLFYSIYNGMSYFGHYAGAGNVEKLKIFHIFKKLIGWSFRCRIFSPRLRFCLHSRSSMFDLSSIFFCEDMKIKIYSEGKKYCRISTLGI